MSHFFYSLSALLCFSCVAISAQTPVLDSLQNALKTAKEDTTKITLLLRLAEETQGTPATSRQHAEAAYTLANARGDKARAAEALNRIAQTHNDQGSYPEARTAAQKALSLAESINDRRSMATAYNQLGAADWRQGNFDAALELLFKALPIMEELGDGKGRAATLNRIGSVYTELQQYSRAREYFQRSLALAESIDDKRRQATQLNNIGASYMYQHQYDSALTYYLQSLALSKLLQDKDRIGLALTSIGETYLYLNRLSDTDTTLARALALSKELKQQDRIACILRLYSDLFVVRKRFTKAIYYGTCAIALADSIGDRLDKRDAMKTLTIAYDGAGNTAKAFALYKDYILLRDSLVNDENAKRAAYRENKYAADKKDAEIKLLKKDAENQALVRNSMAGGLVLVASLVGVLVLSNSRRKKANTLLQSQAAQIQLANTELQHKNIEITEAHMQTQRLFTNVQDSIRYAKRIQDAMLPSTETLNRLLPEHFIFFRPKDVVSGDFYWCKEVHGKVFVAAVDCTGHGVPGAFMSLIGNYLLNDITQRLTDLHPDLVLNELHQELQRVLRQKETNNDDGMDICLCLIDTQTRIVEFAGAMNPLYAVVAGELKEFKGTPEELGGREEHSPVYQRHSLDLSGIPEGGAMLYLTTDGYKDQYNAEKQRFMPKRLRPLLQEIAAKPLEEQSALLGAAIDAHRGEVMQVDDILILGVRV